MNADQHIALASVIAGGATAIISVIVTGVGGSRDRAHRKEMADTERKQQRLADAYVGLLEYVAKLSSEVQTLHPVLGPGRPKSAPKSQQQLDDDSAVQSAVMSRVQAFGSVTVTKLMHTWTESANAILEKAAEIVSRQAEALAGRSATAEDEAHWSGEWDALARDVKTAERAARQALTAQVAAELK